MFAPGIAALATGTGAGVGADAGVGAGVGVGVGVGITFAETEEEEGAVALPVALPVTGTGAEIGTVAQTVDVIGGPCAAPSLPHPRWDACCIACSDTGLMAPPADRNTKGC